MKQLLIIPVVLGFLALDLHARNDGLSPEERETVRQLQASEPRDESARLIRKSRRVVITRRTYEDPTGVRSIRETRRGLDGSAPATPTGP